MKKMVIGIVFVLCLAILTIGGSSVAETWSGTVEIPPETIFNVTLPGLTTGEGLTWEWSTEFGDLDFWIENETGYHEYDIDPPASSDTNSMTIPEDGSYEAKWENLIPAGSVTWNISLTYSVTVINHAPTASASSNKSSGKEPLHVKFTGSGNDVDGNIVDYEWDFGDDTTSGQQNPTHVFATYGTYNVKLTVTDNDGNTDSDTIKITVNENPAPTAVADSDVNGGEPPLEVNFDGSDSSDDPEGIIVSYHWDFDDGEVSTDMNPTHTFAAVGEYDVVLTVTDNHGDTGQDTIRITVSIINLAPTANAAADKTSVPEGQTVTFTDASTDSDGTIVAWTWDFGDGNTSSDQNTTHSYDTAGTYTVVLVVADDDGATDTISLTITVLVDSDGDGHPDSDDEFPNDPTEWEDNDDDGIGDNADPDDDNDGMSDAWEISYGLNPKVNDADDDPDEDGYSNYEEFKEGTNPVDVGSKPTEEKEDFMSSAGGFIILIIIIILVIILLLFLMRKRGGKPVGAPLEEPSEEIGEEEPTEEIPEEEPGEVPEETIEEPSGETADDELDQILEDSEEEKPEY